MEQRDKNVLLTSRKKLVGNASDTTLYSALWVKLKAVSEQGTMEHWNNGGALFFYVLGGTWNKELRTYTTSFC